MSHYEQRLENDLSEIRGCVVALGTSVEKGLESALRALFEVDNTLAYRTILADNPINRSSEALNRLCHQFVARHLPSAGHLRFISSVMRINIGLERIGDYAVTICRETVVLKEAIDEPLRSKIRSLGKHALAMFEDALDAFEGSDYDKARQTIALAARIDEEFAATFAELVTEGREGSSSVKDLFSKLVIISNLERVSDQAKNLCEDVVFALTGETKRRRPARVIFFDEDGVLAPMAKAIGRKAFPRTGEFAAASLTPAELSSDFIEFLAESGHDPANLKSDPVVPDRDWDYHDVLVSLSGPIGRYVKQVPFHSLAFEWQTPKPPDAGMPLDARGQRYAEIYKHLASGVAELLDALRGHEDR